MRAAKYRRRSATGFLTSSIGVTKTGLVLREPGWDWQSRNPSPRVMTGKSGSIWSRRARHFISRFHWRRRRGQVIENRTILLIDDEPQIRRVLRTALSAQGANVIDVQSGEESLELLRE